MPILWGQWVVKPGLAFLCGLTAYRALYLPMANARGFGGSPLLELVLGGALVAITYLLVLFLAGGIPDLHRGRALD